MGRRLVDDAGFLLSRVSGLVARTTNTALEPHGLRVRQYSVLVLACDAPDGLSQRELAATLGLDPSQVVLLVDELQAAGLVERRTSPTDRRTNLVVATQVGSRRRDDAARAADRALEHSLSPLSTEERAGLGDMLTRIMDAADATGVVRDHRAGRRPEDR